MDAEPWPLIAVTVLPPDGTPTHARLGAETRLLEELQLPPELPIEAVISTGLQSCSANGFVLLDNPESFYVYVGNRAVEHDQGGYPAAMSPDGRFVARVVDKGVMERVLYVAELGNNGALARKDETATPRDCISPQLIWHPTQPLVALLCTGQGSGLTWDLRTKRVEALPASDATELLGWRGSPAELLAFRMTTNGGKLSRATVALSATGPRVLCEGCVGNYLPASDSLLVPGESQGQLSLVNLATGSSSPWSPPPCQSGPCTVETSTPDGRWVAVWEGLEVSARKLWLINVATLQSTRLWEDEQERYATTAVLCTGQADRKNRP